MNEIERLFDMTEHPERYSAQDWHNLVGGNPLQEKEKKDAWDDITHQYQARHARLHTTPLRWAAALAGLAMLTGITYATVKYFTNEGRQTPPIATEQAISHPIDTLQAAEKALGTPTDTLSTRIFENVTLHAMLQEMARFYGINIEFDDMTTSQLRLYYEWDQHNSLDEVVRQLNSFEHVSISRHDSILFIH